MNTRDGLDEGHYMQREILEEPGTAEEILREEEGKIRALADVLRQRDTSCIVLAARGTSDHAAQLGKYLFEYLTGIPVSLAAPSLYTLYDAKMRLERTLVIGISQSGESADVNEVVKRSREFGALTVGVTNNEGSTLARTAEHPIFCRAGVEKSVAATKTYIGQLMALYMLSIAWAGKDDMFEELRRVPGHIGKVLSIEESVREMVPRYRYMQECTVIGRGFNYSTALEAALKLKETCYVHAQPYSAADLMHGPIAAVDEGFPVFLVAPPGAPLASMTELARDLRGRRAETIVLSSDPGILDTATVPLEVPVELDELFTPLVYIVPMQLFSYHLAVTMGHNPDKPRTLNKVTITR